MADDLLVMRAQVPFVSALWSAPARRWRDAQRMRAVLPLLTAVCLSCAGSAILMTAVSLRLGQPDVSPSMVQTVLTAYPVGFLLGCILAKPFVMRFGHEAACLGVLGLAFAAGLGFVLSDHLPAWIALRLMGGLAMAALFVIGESWINLFATHRDRGALFGLYMLSTSLAVLLGQLVVGLMGPGSPYLFEAALGFVALSFLPRFAGRRWPALAELDQAEETASSQTVGRLSLNHLFRIAPVTVVSVFQSGVTNMNIFVLTPIYGTQIGLSAVTTVALVTTVSIAGMVAQTPIGWLSDRFDRRLILLFQGTVSLAACLAITVLGKASVPLLFALFFLYGSAALTIYPVAIAHANARLSSRHMVAASGTFLLLYSVGNVGTPGVAAGLMASTVPQAMFGFLGLGALLVAITACLELVRQKTSRTVMGTPVEPQQIRDRKPVDNL